MATFTAIFTNFAVIYILKASMGMPAPLGITVASTTTFTDGGSLELLWYSTLSCSV